MKYSVAPLSYIFVVVSFTLSFAGDAVTIGALTGGVMGKGIFCGFNETDEIAVLSGRALKGNSLSKEDESSAVKQFMLTARLTASVGPQGESCTEFRAGYEDVLNQLRRKY